MNLEGGRRGEAIVAAAGPLSNLVLAAAGAIPLRFILANPELVGSARTSSSTVLYLFVQINLLLMIFNLIPIPPLDGSKVLFAFMDRRTEYQIRPFLEQYGFLILHRDPVLPARATRSAAGSSIPILDGIHQLPGGRLGSASSGRTCGRAWRPRSARRWRPGSRPRSCALFDSMHVADRRHGLDVVASLRADGVDRPRPAARGPAPRRRQGRHRGLAAGRLPLGQRYGDWIWRVAASLPGFGAALERLRDPRRDLGRAGRRGRLLGPDRRR